MNEFVKAWEFLTHHKAFSTVEVITLDDLPSKPIAGIKPSDLTGEYWTNYFTEVLDIDVAMINPETGAIDEDTTKNTLVQIWLECGTREYAEEFGKVMNNHDIDLYCGADTFEEAIIELAKLVREKYGEEQIQ